MRLSIFIVYPASKYFTWQLLWITTRDKARSTFSLSLFLYCFLYPCILLHFGASCTTLLTDFYQSLFGKCIFPLLKILFYFFFYLKKKKVLIFSNHCVFSLNHSKPHKSYMYKFNIHSNNMGKGGSMGDSQFS